VLVVDDNQAVRESLRRSLSFNGYDVELATDGIDALDRIAKQRPDALVLDLMMPRLDGLETCRRLRSAGEDLPILVLTARDAVADRVAGLDAGADDYLPKPFELAILLARLQGLLRRSQWLRSAVTAGGPAESNAAVTQPGDVFSFRGKTIDFGILELSTNRGKIQLTLMEADLLRHLIRSKGRVVSRKSILEEVWGLKEDTDTRAIDNFVVRLRRYIEDDPARPRHLLTVRGVGYRFLAEPEAADE
jgi:two-component system, OmpR family, alkaline phosphatase synthesis response regulator PhoP